MDALIVKKLLSKKEDFLRRHLVLSDTVIEKLQERGVISEFSKKNMKAETSEGQVTVLLRMLKMKGIAVFRDFITVLRETFHGWIADDLLETGISGYDVRKAFDEPTPFREFLSMNYGQELDFGTEKVDVGASSSKMLNAPSFQRGVVGPESFPDRYRWLPDGTMYVAYPQSSRGVFVEDNRDRLKSKHRRPHIARNREEEYSRINHVPDHLRDLEKVFEKESSATEQSMSVLKQEEVSIKVLLQKNYREQQDLLVKQKALTEITGKMKDINVHTAQLYRRQANDKATLDRLGHIQRIPWTSGH